jgi:hypothetical protein
MDKLGLGRKMEQAVMRRWEWNGFTCWQPPRAKYSSQDIFELFDFVAVKPWCPVNLVQVKRHRRKEAETACNAIKAFAELYHAPVAPFLVLWAKERLTESLLGIHPETGRIRFKAWEYTMVGWVNAGEWDDG